jgi:hypothetical protein
MLGAGINRLSVSPAGKRLELLERLEPLEPWIDVRRSNGKFFPTIPADSAGFEASKFAQRTLFFLGAAQRRFQICHSLVQPTTLSALVSDIKSIKTL